MTHVPNGPAKPSARRNEEWYSLTIPRQFVITTQSK